MPVIRQFFSTYFAVIDRYLLREFILNLLAVVGILWFVFIATRFARYLADAAVGNLPSDVIFSLLRYSSLTALDVLLPIATLLAVMLGLGRMNADNELTVMYACGISKRRVTRNVVLFSGTIAVFIAILSLIIVPNALSDRYELEQRAKISANTTGLIAGSFKESKNGDWTFYSEDLSDDKQEMLNVFIKINNAERPMVFRADKAHFETDSQTGDKFLVLVDGFRYEGEAGEQDFRIAQYRTHSLLIEKGQEVERIERQKALDSKTLWQRGEARDLAELQWRISSAIMAVILSLYAMTFANSGPRKGRYTGLFSSILVYITYSNLLAVTRAWIAKGSLNPFIGTIWVHLLMLSILILILNKHRIQRHWQQYLAAKQSVQS